MKRNTVIYDFSKNPITFDFVNFLAFARLTLALANGNASFFLSLLADSWRNETPREVRYDINDRLWRLHNLIVPVCSVTPAILGYNLFLDDRGRHMRRDEETVVNCENGVYMMRALVEIFHKSGFDPHLFVAPEMALSYAKRILSSARDPVVIAIRYSSFEANRNTPSELLIDLVKKLQSSGRSVFLIPDQEAELNRESLPPNTRVIEAAAFNLPLRLALHELAPVSICSGSGPSNFVSLAVSKPSLVIIHPMRPEIPISSPQFLRQQGLEIGHRQPLPWIPENQIWLWDPEVSAQAIFEAAIELADT